MDHNPKYGLKYTILDDTRRAMCAQLAVLKDNFYLAGGTGLALQLGHRISEDFDFFSDKPFDNTHLLNTIAEIFRDEHIDQLQNDTQTLTIIIRGVKVSFFYVEPAPVLPLLQTEFLRIASVQEIGVFKLLALLRASYKDYVDLFVIFQQYTLLELFTVAHKKYPGFDEAMYLKALLSFDDVDLFPIQYAEGFESSPEQVFQSIQQQVDRYLQLQ